jgi:hypothetical protein
VSVGGGPGNRRLRPRFGPAAGPSFATWSEAVIASLHDTAADLDDAGLDATDVREVTAAAARHRSVLDEITEPRLLHGDLWTFWVSRVELGVVGRWQTGIYPSHLPAGYHDR